MPWCTLTRIDPDEYFGNHSTNTFLLHLEIPEEDEYDPPPPSNDEDFGPLQVVDEDQASIEFASWSGKVVSALNQLESGKLSPRQYLQTTPGSWYYDHVLNAVDVDDFSDEFEKIEEKVRRRLARRGIAGAETWTLSDEQKEEHLPRLVLRGLADGRFDPHDYDARWYLYEEDGDDSDEEFEPPLPNWATKVDLVEGQMGRSFHRTGIRLKKGKTLEDLAEWLDAWRARARGETVEKVEPDEEKPNEVESGAVADDDEEDESDEENVDSEDDDSDDDDSDDEEESNDPDEAPPVASSDGNPARHAGQKEEQ